MLRRSIVALAASVVLGSSPFACAAAHPFGASTAAPGSGSGAEGEPLSPPSPEREPGSPAFVDSGLRPSPDGRGLLEGGSLRPQDSSFVPDGAGVPDSLTPPMLRDASLPKPGPKPMSAGDGR